MTEQEFIKVAQTSGFDNIQLTKTLVKEDSVTYINENRKSYDISTTISYLIKAEKDKKTVTVKSNYLDNSLIEKLKMKLKYIESEEEDKYLTDTKNNNHLPPQEEIDITDVFPKLEKVVSLKEKSENISKIELEYSSIYKQTRILNNKGVDITTSSHNDTFYCEVMARKGEKSTNASRILKSSNKNIDFEKITKELIKETQIRLEEKEIKTGKYSVIFQNKKAGELIGNIMEALNADKVQKGLSLYKDKLETKIASPLLNIVEDPTNTRYPGYCLFDSEGTKTVKKDIIRNGILKTYFHNNKTALKDKVLSTGNGYGRIANRNLYVEEGTKSLEELIKEMSSGIVVTSFMCGMGSIRLETGNISLQIFGYLVENGRIVGGIKPAILTTTFEELLPKLLAVGNDLTFTNIEVGSPSLLFDKLDIAVE